MKKPKIIIICILITFLIAFIVNWIYCINTIEIKNYNFNSDKIDTSLRFVFISDLHNKEYGTKNCNLVSKIEEQNPDFIAVGGDMVTRYSEDIHVMKELLPQLAEIAPTYCVVGNHESYLADEIDFKSEIDSTGALLLDNESIEFEKDGETILVGGLSDYPFDEANVSEKLFWDEFKEEAKNQYSILLHHQPEFIKSFGYNSNIDLIMSGHTHGGQIQIPFVGGLIAPSQGLFPIFDKGEFDLGNTTLLISAGLGDVYPAPRINNCHDMIVVDIY